MTFKTLKTSIWPKVILVAAIAYPAGVWAQANATHTVSQKDRTYSPGDITINAGDTLKIVNDDIFLHQAYVESDEMDFDSDSMEEGESVSVTFDKAGTFALKCKIHPKMSMDITVK